MTTQTKLEAFKKKIRRKNGKVTDKDVLMLKEVNREVDVILGHTGSKIEAPDLSDAFRSGNITMNEYVGICKEEGLM